MDVKITCDLLSCFFMTEHNSSNLEVTEEYVRSWLTTNADGLESHHRDMILEHWMLLLRFNNVNLRGE